MSYFTNYKWELFCNLRVSSNKINKSDCNLFGLKVNLIVYLAKYTNYIHSFMCPNSLHLFHNRAFICTSKVCRVYKLLDNYIPIRYSNYLSQHLTVRWRFYFTYSFIASIGKWGSNRASFHNSLNIHSMDTFNNWYTWN